MKVILQAICDGPISLAIGRAQRRACWAIVPSPSSNARDYPGLLRQSLKFCKITPTYKKCCFSSPRVWDHNSKPKALLQKVKTCGPPPGPILANSMSY